MRKKQEKTREEKAAETYFPMRQSDIKLTVEKPYKKPLTEFWEIIEQVPGSEVKNKVAKKPYKKRSPRKSSSSKKSPKAGRQEKVTGKKKTDILTYIIQ